MSLKLLVDTHALLWWLEDDSRLPARAAQLIDDPANVAAVSAASVWEVAIKTAIGKLRAPARLPEAAAEAGLAMLPIDMTHAWASRDLPLLHRDPFDRMLVVQALVEGFDVVSADSSFDAYGIRRHWK